MVIFDAKLKNQRAFAHSFLNLVQNISIKFKFQWAFSGKKLLISESSIFTPKKQVKGKARKETEEKARKEAREKSPEIIVSITAVLI